MTSGSIFLLPCFMGDDSPANIISGWELELLNTLNLFIAENEKSCRRFMRKAGFTGDFNTINIVRFDKNSGQEVISDILNRVSQGIDAGIVSESGAPALADPGSNIILQAHLKGINIIPVPGPSAIMQAIMSSGLNGQQFVFHGYLPIDSVVRRKHIKSLELESNQKKYAHFFIETPYRNNAMFKDLIQSLSKKTLLSIASNINLPNEFIKTESINYWESNTPELHKQPTVFGILGN